MEKIIYLRSDAYSRFLPVNEAGKHNEEVDEATLVLKRDVIPEVALDLQTQRLGSDFSLQAGKKLYLFFSFIFFLKKLFI